MPEWFAEYLKKLSYAEKAELTEYFDGDPDAVEEVLEIIDPEVM